MKGILAALLFLAGGCAFAAGSTALDAFNFVTGARAAGMGGAVAAAVSDPTALQWNPAGLARQSDVSVTLSHLLWVADINYSYVGLAMPVFLGTVAASIQALNYGPIESTKSLQSAVDASDFGFTVGGAVPFMPGLWGGASAKFFRHSLAGSGAMEAAVDVGGLYDAVPDKLALALVIQNVGYSGPLEGYAPPLPTSVKAGLAYRFNLVWERYPVVGQDFTWSPEANMLLTGDVMMYQKGEPAYFSLGVEAGTAGVLFGRLGYLNSLRSAGTGAGFSIGVGLKVFGLRFDYAFGSVGDLGSAQYMSMGWSPERGRAKPPAAERQLRAAQAPSATPAAPGSPAAPALDVARDYAAAVAAYDAGDYASAADKAAALVAASPDNWQAWQLLGSCRLAQGDRAGALEAYRSSLAAHPDNPQLKSWMEQAGETVR